jgi:hypothetical protein
LLALGAAAFFFLASDFCSCSQANRCSCSSRSVAAVVGLDRRAAARERRLAGRRTDTQKTPHSFRQCSAMTWWAGATCIHTWRPWLPCRHAAAACPWAAAPQSPGPGTCGPNYWSVAAPMDYRRQAHSSSLSPSSYDTPTTGRELARDWITPCPPSCQLRPPRVSHTTRKPKRTRKVP